MKTSGREPCRQPLRGVHERIEPAAEAPPWNFLGGEPLRAEHGRVHQVAPLVVGDQPHANSSPREVLGQLADGGGLAGAQEAADHDVAGFGIPG